MPRYQLRLPDKLTIADVIATMVHKAWDVCQPYVDERNRTPEDYADFEMEIHVGIKPYLAAFDLCGLVPECAEEIEGNPLVDYEDSLYHLILPHTFSDFVDQLAYSAFYSIKHLLTQKEQGLEEIRRAFQHGLGSYLYFNPACGRLEVCDTSTPIDPWKY